jgi:putative ABC transport system permease protein
MNNAVRATVQGLSGAVRRSRRDMALVVAYGALVAAVAFGALAAPIALARAADDGLREAIVAAQPGTDVAVEYPGRAGLTVSGSGSSFTDPLEAAALGGLDDVVLDTVGAPVVTLTTGSLITRVDAGAFAVRLVHAPSADVTWVDGEPSGTEPPEGQIEVGLTEATATAMGLSPGDTFELAGDGRTVRVAGIFGPVDPDDLTWADVPELLASVPVRDDDVLRPVSVLLADGSVAEALEGLPSESVLVRVRLRVDTAGLTLSDVPALRRAAARVGGDPAAMAASTAGLPTVRTHLAEGLDGFTVPLAVTRSQAATVLTGLTVAGGMVLVLAARLLTGRRRTALELERARGASVASVGLRAAVESVPVTLLAGGVALAAIMLVLGQRSGEVTALLDVPARRTDALAAALVLVVGAGAPAVLAAQVASSSWSGRRVPANRRDRDRAARTVRGWRLSAELAVVALAAGAVAAALRRGVVPGGDLFVHAAPVLLAAAGTVLVLRGVPAGLGIAARVAARGRGVVSLVAASRAAGGRSRTWRADAAAPVLAVTVTAALAVSCGAAAATVRHGQDHTAGVAVAAEARVDRPEGGLRLDALDGASGTEVAVGTVLPARTFARGSGVKVTVLAVDTAMFEQFAALSGTGEVGEGEAVPALLHPDLERTARLLAPDVWVGGTTVPLDVAGTVDLAETGPYLDVAGPPEEPVVVVDRDALAGSLGPESDELPGHTVWLDGPGADDLAAELRAAAPSSTVTTRDGYRQSLQDDPLASGLVLLYVVAAGLFVALGAAAVLLTGLATAAGRTRVLAVLRTLGVPRRSGRSLTVAELAPVVTAAVVAGMASGVLVAVLLTSAQGLGSLTGGGRPDLVLPWWPFAAVTGATVLAMAVAVVAESRARRDVRIGEVLRAW